LHGIGFNTSRKLDWILFLTSAQTTFMPSLSAKTTQADWGFQIADFGLGKNHRTALG
jgi:hypothetical protein